MKNEKQVLLDELDSLMTKLDENWNGNNFIKCNIYYKIIKGINTKLGLFTPRLLKLIDYNKLDNGEINFLTNKF